MKYLTGILVILLLVGGIFSFKKALSVELTDPFIEVSSLGIFEIDPESKEVVRELATGDELTDGAVIRTNETGVGIIYFPDGSNISLDVNTEITLEEGQYDKKSGSLVVKVALSAGKIWSKVITLATPESEWEIETANAVATVRGTSFGSVYLEEETNFIGSENSVEIQAKDPETGERKEETKTTITTDDIVIINKEIQKEVVAERIAIIKNKIGEEALINTWVTKERDKDKKIDNRIDELKEEGFEEKEVRIKIKKETQDKFRDKVLERRKIRKEERTEKDDPEDASKEEGSIIGFSLIRNRIDRALIDSGNTDIAKQIENLSDREYAAKLQLLLGEDWLKTLTNPEAFKEAIIRLHESDTEVIREEILNQIDTSIDTVKTTDSSSIAKPLPKSVGIKSSVDLSKTVTEGTSIPLKAILFFSDNTTRDATSEVLWQVLGPIGTVDTRGNFTAKISLEFSEFGESSGSIIATWKNESGDVNLLGKTPIFKVVPLLEQLDLRG